MTQKTSPFIAAAWGWSLGESGWNLGMDENLLKFSFLFDGNIDGIVSTLPAPISGQAYFLTTDKKLYFAVENSYREVVPPLWINLHDRLTGVTYQFDGVDLVEVVSSANLDSRLDSAEATIADLGSAAFEPTSSFATPQDVIDAQTAAEQYTDTEVSAVQSQVTTIDNNYQNKNYGSTTIPVRLGNIVIPEQFGAVGNGVNDDTTAINSALATGLPVEGLPGKVYGVSGNIQYTGALFRLSNISFKQLSPNATTRRTLFYNGTGKVQLENVKVDRNGNGLGGALNDAAGIWIAGATGGYVRNCEVFGNDFGTGIALISCLDTLVENNHVHDIQGGTSGSPVITDDTIQGIWAYLCGRVKIRNNKVVTLTNIWTGQVSTPKYTRGIAIGGCFDYEVCDNFVDAADQGIDSSGGDNNRRAVYYGNIINNCYTWGIKFANTCIDILVEANRVRRAGAAAIVCSAPTSDIGVGVDVLTQRITIQSNELDDSGFGGNWDTFNGIGPCGVMILNNATTYPSYPKGIKIRNNRIFGASGKMKYGIYNQTTSTSVAKDWNESVNNNIADATVADLFGVNAALMRRTTATTQSTVANTDLSVALATIVSDPGTMYLDASNLQIRRAGWYKVDATVRWNGSATDTCSQKIVVNGSSPSDTEGYTTFPGSAGLKRYPVSYRGYLAVGDTVRLLVNSGTVAAGIVSASLSIEPCTSQSA